jgi:hypothetical protein
MGLLPAACGPASQEPSPAPISVTPATTALTSPAADSGHSAVSATTTTASVVVLSGTDLDTTQLTNSLEELDQTLADLTRSLTDEEGDPLNE